MDYKHTKIKQYHKGGRALRTETTINDSRDFEVGKRLCNLPALAAVGFTTNRRLLDVERLGHNPSLGQQTFAQICSPAIVEGQRASALRFNAIRTQALLSALVVFRLLPRGFTNVDRAAAVLLLRVHNRLLRPGLAQLTDPDPPVPTPVRAGSTRHSRISAAADEPGIPPRRRPAARPA